jgi:osmotically-inducible protein OsmY
MARFDDDPGARDKRQPRRHARDESWYDRWISSMADDVASKMTGEEERAAHMQALRDRFNQLRRRLAMRRSRFRGIGPRGYQRPDERIHEEVNDRLTNDPYIDATEIDVSVAEGVVTLNGTIENRAEKRLVEDCVDAVPGVRDVANNLRIREMEQARSEADEPREGPAVK